MCFTRCIWRRFFYSQECCFAESRAADTVKLKTADTEAWSLGLAAGMCALAGLVSSGRRSRIEAEAARREEVNAVNEAVMDYCRAHPKTLYLEDIYSTVAYSEKLMTDRDKPFNYDLMGGWLVKSPLTSRKLSTFGFSSIGRGSARRRGCEHPGGGRG